MKLISSNSGIVLLLLSFVLLGSCTLQKRKHLPGYSVQWNSKNPDKTGIRDKKNVQENDGATTVEISHTENRTSEVLEVSSDVETYVLGQNIYKVLAKSMVNSVRKDSCDNLITKEGEEFNCKIVEIGIDVIKYRKCGFDGSPLISIPRSAVLMIRYSNGEKEIIKDIKPDEELKHSTVKSVPKKRLDVMGLVGFCLTIASIVPWWLVSAIIGLVAGILGIVFGSISLARILRKRDSRKGLGFAIVSLILGVLLVVATLIVWAAIGVI